MKLLIKWLMMNIYYQIDTFVMDMADKVDEKGKKLIDVGGGEGKDANNFVKLTYKAQDIKQNSAKTIDYVGDISKVKGKFDYILCTQVLEHVKEPGEFMRKMNKLLKPGGQVWLTTNFCYQLHMEPDDYYRFTKHGLRYLGESNGFKVKHLRAQNGIGGVLAYTIVTLPLRLGLDKWKVSYWGYIVLFSPLIVLVNLVGMGIDLFDRDKKLTNNYEVIYIKT